MKQIFHLSLCIVSFMGSLLFGADASITVNAAEPIRTIPDTMYGGNLMAWDGAQNGSNTTFNNLLKASGRKYMRWCGGSWGDSHLWSDIEGPNRKNTWKVSYTETLNLFSKISEPGQTTPPTFQPIVNFPGYWYDALQDGTPQDPNDNNHSVAHQAAVNAAVAWVQDQSARTPTAPYWEIGNEIGGTWEAGYFKGISGTFYGDYFADFVLAMKAVNPTIKIGAVASESHDLNPYGWYEGYWTYDMLMAASAKGVIPDFLIIHQYPGGSTASTNPALLSDTVNDISDFTSNLDAIVEYALGSEYVGQIRYWMTEYDANASDTYNRRQCYVNAMFHLQYALEMARCNWEGANAWAQWEYGSNYFAYPVWYVHPLLINRFGRHMVEVTDSHSLIRAYAAFDAAGNLTIAAVNNSPTDDLTTDIHIEGFQAGANGLRWLVEPAGNMVAGGATIQDYDNIKINGTVHPDPLTVRNLAGTAFTASNDLTLTLPKSAMLFLTIPRNQNVQPDSTPPSPDPARWAVRPYVSGNGSLRMEAAAASDLNAVQYYFACTSGGGHDSGWQSKPIFEDTNLVPGVLYSYTVKARDLSAEHNETAPSPEASVTMVSPAASNLSLINPSFEDAKIGWSFDPGLKFSTNTSQATDGLRSLHAGYYTGVPDIYFYEKGIWQDTDYTIQSGDLFVLKFDYWSENGWGAHEVNADIQYYNPANPADTGQIATTQFQTGGQTYQWLAFTMTADVSTVPVAVGKKLRIRFRPMGYSWAYYKFDNIRLYQSVYNPVPSAWASSVSNTQVFSWTPGFTNWQSKNCTFDVYLDTDYARVNTMHTQAHAAAGLNQAGFNPADFSGNTGYFWRVVMNEPKTGGTVRHVGPVWYFTPVYQWLYGDFTESGTVDFDDIPGFVRIWLESECTAAFDFDLNSDCRINLVEFSEMASNWLDQY